ncbi:MAG TPA: glycosyl hydrolase [Candidatus Dormibacteraeota bacterium]|nr:glycosyl hydrolase [Candidatus Dormibacteraeota bacterium]
MMNLIESICNPSSTLAKASVLALAFAVCGLAAPAAGGAANPKHTASLYWGAAIGSQITGEKAPWDMSAVNAFERVTGKGLSLIQFFSPFAECATTCQFSRFPLTPMENARKYGAIPVFSWNSSSSPPERNQSAFSLSRIIDGSYDAYIREFAEKAKSWGHPFFLRFDWEMNGNWFPWSQGANGNKPGEFVAAWRHVHDIFTSVGATNATWVWCPNVDISGDLTKLRTLYPGNRYVDWTCLDGFNWGERRGSPGWLRFNQIYRSTYQRIVQRIAPRKPFMIGEVASAERGGSKANWIKEMLRVVRTSYRKARALIWLDVNDRGANWPLESSAPSARDAFRNGIQNPAFVPNVFSGLAQSPIRPPARR